MTYLAARQFGLDFVEYELEERYVRNAERRLREGWGCGGEKGC